MSLPVLLPEHARSMRCSRSITGFDNTANVFSKTINTNHQRRHLLSGDHGIHCTGRDHSASQRAAVAIGNDARSLSPKLEIGNEDAGTCTRAQAIAAIDPSGSPLGRRLGI